VCQYLGLRGLRDFKGVIIMSIRRKILFGFIFLAVFFVSILFFQKQESPLAFEGTHGSINFYDTNGHKFLHYDGFITILECDYEHHYIAFQLDGEDIIKVSYGGNNTLVILQ